MSIHFAAPAKPGRSPACAPIAKAMVARAVERVANDNAGQSSLAGAPSNDRLLRAALRHFARHGMGAAQEARAQAIEALEAKDAQSFDWWLGITRKLDRRLAKELEKLSA